MWLLLLDPGSSSSDHCKIVTFSLVLLRLKSFTDMQHAISSKEDPLGRSAGQRGTTIHSLTQNSWTLTVSSQHVGLWGGTNTQWGVSTEAWGKHTNVTVPLPHCELKS